MSDSDHPKPPANQNEPTFPASPDDAPTIVPVTSIDEPTLISGSSSPPVLKAPDLKDFEILEELGRGGMGVVYKARDRNLDRTVAIKMIVGGKLASDMEVQRLRLEAEAAARLDHPGIVPVYDVGEADGNHFISMKFISGGTMAAHGERYRDDVRSAVEILIKVARAVQHAHQRGVLHRDLKPANILIDEDGEPLVTDLGLAKRMDSESELTQTGFVMGTPGFMAPEQAEGRKDITTSADIFSLGAMLHWLITGEAPFRGDSPVQILMKTLEGEIPSLRGSVPNADADLDLICQKSMSREQSARYSSAGAFADDLQAWMDGELLSVRAPTALSLASLWVRKNLRTVLASGITGICTGIIVGMLMLVPPLYGLAHREHTYEALRAQGDRNWAASFTWFREMPGGFVELITLLVVPAVSLAGIVNVWWIKPKTKEGNIASGITAGLLAGIIAYTMSIGWGPVSYSSVEKGVRDIDLLSNSLWLESEAEKSLARQALVQRYPGLEDIDLDKRGGMISGKIRHDQDTGILPGMWLGIAVTLLLVVLPLFAASALSGGLWQQGVRGVEWMGRTWERGIYSSCFFAFAGITLQPIYPSWPYHLATLAAFAFALYLAMRDARWYWRVLSWVVSITCMMSNMQQMELVNNPSVALVGAKSDDDFRTALGYFEKRLERKEHQFVRFRAAVLCLQIGDEEAYQRHCAKLFANFENAYRPEIAERIAKVGLLRPDLQKDPEKFHRLAEIASGYESSRYSAWAFAIRGLSEARKGQSAGAIQWCKRSRDVPTKEESPYLLSTINAVKAIAHLEAGDAKSARDALEEAASATKKDDDAGKNNKAFWHDRAFAGLLRDEAEKRLKTLK